MVTKSLHCQADALQRLGMAAVIAILGLLPVGLAAHGHASPGPDIRSRSNWFVDMNRFALSAHASFDCGACHADLTAPGRRHPDTASPDFLKLSATRRYDYSRCATCHKLSYQRYLNGGHAAALNKERSASPPGKRVAGNQHPAPTCGECHSAHYAPSGQSRVALGRQMVAQCGRCHPQHAVSYLENIHGRQGVDLQNESAAFCTDCHGAHTVTSLEKSADALPVCRRCHPKATAEFTNIVIHANLDNVAARESSKKEALRWINGIKLAAIWVVALSLVFFCGHALLWLLREKHEHLRKH